MKPEEKLKKALITGGAGFVGSHLAEALLGKGWQVEVIDNLSAGSIASPGRRCGANRSRFMATAGSGVVSDGSAMWPGR